jgi:hypothetical protein
LIAPLLARADADNRRDSVFASAGRQMKVTSCVWGSGLFPVGDEWFVGEFSVLADRALVFAPLDRGESCRVWVAVASAGWAAGGELELAELLLGEGGRP